MIPAHDEQEQIGETLASLAAQTRPPQHVVVVCDNCSDATADIARVWGAEVVETVDNRHRKAGALNQALAVLLPQLHDDDRVLVMDADSSLDPRFIESADERLAQGDISACGGVFTGKPGGGFVGMLQRNEYSRYARDVARRKGKVLVLTGTATMFRTSVLRAVAQARGDGLLPGTGGLVYDTKVLTEDNELTLAMLHLGHRIVSPRHCRLTTEVMPTWRALWGQRLRWKRGAIENLTDYGWTSVTREYWARQLVSALGVLVTFVYLLALLYGLLVLREIHIYPLWAAVTGIFVLERVVTVRRRGPAQMALASILVVEMVFDVFLQLCQGRAFLESFLRTERRW